MVFHSDHFYDQLEPTIPALVDLLFSSDDKTRTNAAGALGNMARNSKSLDQALARHQVPQMCVTVLNSSCLFFLKEKAPIKFV
eukprot:m.241886 g.241886  ORF g.241886 m.241886 type:complete len:83 (+) comp10940_c2_seq11:3698-3946(+)